MQHAQCNMLVALLIVSAAACVISATPCVMSAKPILGLFFPKKKLKIA